MRMVALPCYWAVLLLEVKRKNNSWLTVGGGGLGIYHYGVLKCLYEEGMVPRVISGSSAGSIYAAIFATKKYEELKQVYIKSQLAIITENSHSMLTALNWLISKRFKKDQPNHLIWDVWKDSWPKDIYSTSESSKSFWKITSETSLFKYYHFLWW